MQRSIGLTTRGRGKKFVSHCRDSAFHSFPEAHRQRPDEVGLFVEFMDQEGYIGLREARDGNLISIGIFHAERLPRDRQVLGRSMATGMSQLPIPVHQKDVVPQLLYGPSATFSVQIFRT